MPEPMTPGVELAEPRGLHVRFVRTTVADDALEMEWTIPTGGRLVAIPHLHPDGPEDWRVLEGVARYRVGWGRAKTAAAPGGWTVPGGTPHVHPANAGSTPLVVHQTIAPDPPMPDLTSGIERYFETIFAIAQRGGVDGFGRIKNPLQDALTLWETLVPGTWLAGIPRPVQRAFIGGGAKLARRRGYEPWLTAERV